jgi:PHD/YefM family antitoxin component YafN of YafNO toxin-antitoxin module
MQVFTSEDLQKRQAEVQQSALVEPTMITCHGRPQLIMMSVDEFDRLRGHRHLVLHAAGMSEDIVAEMTRIADEYPVDDANLVLMGGLLDDEPTDPTARGAGSR